MNYYDRFSPDLMRTIKELNDKMREEENVINPDKEKILKLRQQILMKGLEMSVGFNGNNYNPYK
jgi:hypothetical protein